MSKTEVRPSESFEYYQGTVFSSNFEIILQHLCNTISGDPNVWWHLHVLNKYGPQESAFILNCGNGWVERDLFGLGLIKSCIASDIMEKHINEAKSESARIGMPAHYILGDINQADFGELQTDIAVNVGSMHHVAYINKVTALIAKIVRNGFYIGYDYIGPHRNQYSWNVWSRLVDFNATLPNKYQAQLRYPHMDTMLVMDASEAVHSELQVEVLNRYFDLLEYKALGGGIANAILYNNMPLYADQHTEEGRNILNYIVEADSAAAKEDPEFHNYAFFVAKPKPEGSVSAAQLREWQNQENEREATAAKNGGRYYPVSALERIYNELAKAEYELKQMK